MYLLLFSFQSQAQYLLQFHQERCDLNKVSKGTEMAIGDKCKKYARQIQNLPRVYIFLTYANQALSHFFSFRELSFGCLDIRILMIVSI